jgi:Tol biopolymer transport system component
MRTTIGRLFGRRLTVSRIRHVVLLIALVAVGLAWSMPEAAGDPAPPPPTGRIAFASDRLGIGFGGGRSGPICLAAHCSDIYLINADGTGLVRLTPNSLTGFQGLPSWSPDGTRIAFYRTLKGFRGQPSHQIYVMNADGSNITQITSGNQLSVAPAWSPDGTKIAFVRRPRPITDGHIALMNPDGTGFHEITSGPNFDFRPQWAPDGSKIVFERDSPDFSSCSVYVVAPDGTGLTRLIGGSGCVGDPAWSPDGSTISFWNYGNQALQSYDLASGDVSTLATAAALGGDPAVDRISGWSPDGQWLAVGACCDVSLGVGLVLISADGKTILPVPNGASAMAPAWQPTG